MGNRRFCLYCLATLPIHLPDPDAAVGEDNRGALVAYAPLIEAYHDACDVVARRRHNLDHYDTPLDWADPSVHRGVAGGYVKLDPKIGAD